MTAPVILNGNHPGQMFYGKMLTFNEKSHRYRWGGEYLTSVTTITNRLAKNALLQWYADFAADSLRAYLKQNMQDTEGVSYDSFLETLDKAYEHGKAAPNSYKEAAGDKGTAIHKYCTDVLTARHQLPLPDDPLIRPACEGFLEWFTQHNIHPIRVEGFCVSEKFKYAGRCDLFGRIDEVMTVLDIKTGNTVCDRKSGDLYPEICLQMTGYEVALCEELQLVDPMTRMVLHIDKRTGKCTPYKKAMNPVHIAAWVALTQVDKYLRAMNRVEAA